MRYDGFDSWRLSLSRYDTLTDVALWVRATAGIAPAPERLIPGPLDADLSGAFGDPVLGPQWSDWWHAMLLSPHAVRGGPFPGADGLAGFPELHAFVAARWRDAVAWHGDRQRRGLATHPPADRTATEVVQAFEARTGRRARGFHAEILVIPVRDDVIRRIDGERYLIPEPVYTSRRWRVWLSGLVDRLA